MAQSQYAKFDDIIALAITPAQSQRYGGSAVAAALKAASSIADTYLPSQFTLPLQTSPQGWDMSLTLAVCNIAAYLLACQFGFNPNAPADALIEKRYADALTWLGLIRDKKLFPQWTDSGGSSVVPEAGDYIASDPVVGFTKRGTATLCVNDPWDFWSIP